MTEMDELMRCPVDWSTQFHSEAWSWSLPYLDWYYCVAKNAVDETEVRFWADEMMREWLRESYSQDPVAMKRLFMNLKLRRGAAEDLYKKRAQRLYGLQFMTPEEHGKHFAGKMSQEEVLARSKNRPSLFWENYSSVRLKQTFWSWFETNFDIVTNYAEYADFMNPESDQYRTSEARLWRRFLENHSVRICMDALQPVGASKGKLTSFLCYDLNVDTKTVHCFPIGEGDAKLIMCDSAVLAIDTLNC